MFTQLAELLKGRARLSINVHMGLDEKMVVVVCPAKTNAGKLELEEPVIINQFSPEQLDENFIDELQKKLAPIVTPEPVPEKPKQEEPKAESKPAEEKQEPAAEPEKDEAPQEQPSFDF